MAGAAPSSEMTTATRAVSLFALCPAPLLFYACRYSYPAL